jgi:hypothetical protein
MSVNKVLLFSNRLSSLNCVSCPASYVDVTMEDHGVELLVLDSTSSHQFHPDNKLTHFRCQIPQSHVLFDQAYKYEIGVKSLSFSAKTQSTSALNPALAHCVLLLTHKETGEQRYAEVLSVKGSSPTRMKW